MMVNPKEKTMSEIRHLNNDDDDDAYDVGVLRDVLDLPMERPSEGKAEKNPLNLYRFLVTLIKAVSMEIEGQKLIARV